MELDQKTLRQIREIGGDQLLRRLVDLFVENTPMRLEEMRRALAGEDWTRAALAAHSLRSSSVTLGATELASRAADIESLANEKDLGPVEAALPDLENLARAAQSSLRALLGG